MLAEETACRSRLSRWRSGLGGAVTLEDMIRQAGESFRMGDEDYSPEVRPAWRLKAESTFIESRFIADRDFADRAAATRHVTVAERAAAQDCPADSGFPPSALFSVSVVSERKNQP